MVFATGALGTLLPKLGQLLQDEYKLQKGVKKDIEFVSRELESIHAALRNVGEVLPEQLREQVRIWACDTRELSYDMEDIVDCFLVRVQGSKPSSKRCAKRFVKKMINIVTKATARHEIGQEIKDIKDRVKEVAERRDRYKVDAVTPVKTTVDPRITSLYTKATNLVGIDEAREELIRRLTKEDDLSAEQRVVSIVGFGGLGKTTLAKAVYNKLQPEFNCVAFISVSRNPNMTKILKDILYDIDKIQNHSIHNITLDQKQLVDLVQEFLQNKRYLIVIDDIWDIEPWEMIRCALPDNGLKSRIITTTRIVDVAEHVGGCYKMNPLTHKSSKILFYGRIFGSEGNCPEQFSDVSEKILKKCGGVPLAIVTTSSLLANKSRNIKEWYNVCHSIGSGLGNNPHMDSMKRILLLSYYNLPSHLKICLLYLSIFPEDYKVGWARLIWMWIAEGFVQRGEGQESLFEIGQSYYNDLVNASLVQPANMDEDDMSPLHCWVHDIVLDLICCLSREENFAITLYGACKKFTSSFETKVRRLSLHDSTNWPILLNTSKLRSLITIRSSVIVDSKPLLSCYHLIRVLDLEDCNLEDYPSMEFVATLLHLRYLSLSSTRYAGKVPTEIGKLQFLQTLSFNGTFIKELPSSILGLRNLMCLYVGDSTRLPNGLRNLSSLEALMLNVDSSHMVEELGHLTQLRFLMINLTREMEGRWDESMFKVLVASLGNLHKIQTLIVSSDSVEVDLEGSMDSLWNLCHLGIFGTSRLPKWMHPASFPLISHLHIRVSQLRSEDIQVMGKLLTLRYLILEVAGGMQAFVRFSISADAFPCVTRCRFYGFSMVPSLFPPGAMPRLQHFKFDIRPEDFSGTEFNVNNLSLIHLPLLQTVRVRLDGEQTVSEELAMKVKEALKNEARAHPNHPDIDIEIHDEWIQLST